MARGREILVEKMYHRQKKGNGKLKRKAVAAFAGTGGSNGSENTKALSAQIQIFDDYEKVEKPGSKPKNVIRLEGAKIESSGSSPASSITGSPAYSSMTSPQAGARLSASPSPSTILQNGGSDLHCFTVATNSGEVHEFKVESENERLRWVKILQLLVMYPFSPIPEEPKTNPIKDSFRRSLEAKQYNADSVWPVYILPEEVGSKSGILGLHILALYSGVPNYSMGRLEIISPSDHSRAVVTWDRDKMRRTGKTGHLVFIEIGRRCEGGPGLVWMYSGYQNDAQALRETLHRFLFQGDGRAIAMDSQSSQATYDVPRSSLASVDSQPHSINKRSSIPSGYHNHLLTRSKSQDHDSGIHSLENGRTPPALDGPPVRLDKHPSIRRKRDSEPCVIRRSNSVQSPYGSYNDKDMADPMFDDEGSLSRRTSHSDTPPDESEGIMMGQMDGMEMMSNTRHYDVVRSGDDHPLYNPRAPETEDEYMKMVHPKAKYRNDGYVYMKRTNSVQASSTIPVPISQSDNSNTDEYNTLQHFQGRQSAPRVGSTNYDTLPTIMEKQGGRRRDDYMNYPPPQDLKGVVPRHYQPNYENQEPSFKGRRGSHGRDVYENSIPRKFSENAVSS